VTIKAQATSGVAPKWVMLAPVTGRAIGPEAGWLEAGRVDLFELNEAFMCRRWRMKELGLDAAKVNVNGGRWRLGIRLASGARCW
jgi:acetyl-CoA C-acetyltransferase